MSAKNPPLMNRLNRNDQMTPQLIGDDIINIQNVDDTNQDLPTETEDYTKLQAISEYQPENQPSALRHVQTKAGHVLAGRRQCPTRCGSTQRRRVLVSYLVWLYVAQMSAGAHLDGQYLAV